MVFDLTCVVHGSILAFCLQIADYHRGNEGMRLVGTRVVDHSFIGSI